MNNEKTEMIFGVRAVIEAIQAGREVRIIVKPEKVSDAEMVVLARDIAQKVENETNANKRGKFLFYLALYYQVRGNDNVAQKYYITVQEMQTPMFNLINKSIEENDLKTVCTAKNVKLQDVDSSFNERFSLIVCNPPYMKVESGEVNKLDNIAVCTSEVSLSLSELCLAFKKCLKFGGRVCLVHRADRLVEVICELKKNNIEICLLSNALPLLADTGNDITKPEHSFTSYKLLLTLFFSLKSLSISEYGYF